MSPNLTAVGPDDTAPRKVTSVFDAIEFGTRLDELLEMRKVVARAIDGEPSDRDLAALTKRLSEISREIVGLRREWAEEARENDVSSDEEFSAEAI